MTYFLKDGNRWNVTAKDNIDLHEELPVGTYTVKFNDMGGFFFLERIEDFEITGKLYGETTRHATRILDTFQHRPAATGIMLTGEKGSGKTLLAKKLSLEAQKIGVPTIVINMPWCGELFNTFMQSIDQPTVVIFDEFEKVYDSQEQEKMLTLLDGVFPSKKLFILTCNDSFRVNTHMKNRPGRIFYRIDYTGLSPEFIIEYCNDNLKNLEHIDSMCRMAALFGSFNFDILKAMVEEMNRYDESPQEVMAILNAKPEASDVARYEAELVIDGESVFGEDSAPLEWRGNPLQGLIYIDYETDEVDSDGDREWDRAEFQNTDLHSIDPATGKFTYNNKKGDKLTLVKVKEKTFDYNAY